MRNQISDLSPLSDLKNLTGLWLGDNQITDVSPLSNLTNLSVLGLENNQIEDISPLLDNTGIDAGDLVDIRENPLSSDSENDYAPQLKRSQVNILWDSNASSDSRWESDWYLFLLLAILTFGAVGIYVWRVVRH